MCSGSSKVITVTKHRTRRKVPIWDDISVLSGFEPDLHTLMSPHWEEKTWPQHNWTKQTGLFYIHGLLSSKMNKMCCSFQFFSPLTRSLRFLPNLLPESAAGFFLVCGSDRDGSGLCCFLCFLFLCGFVLYIKQSKKNGVRGLTLPVIYCESVWLENRYLGHSQPWH